MDCLSQRAPACVASSPGVVVFDVLSCHRGPSSRSLVSPGMLSATDGSSHRFRVESRIVTSTIGCGREEGDTNHVGG